MLDINRVNPYIRVAMYSVLDESIHIKRRVIFDYELIYIERGEFTFVYNDKPYKCGKDTFILIRPGVPHSFERITSELSQPHVHFDMTFCPNSITTPVSFKDIPDMNNDEKVLIREDVLSDYPVIPFVRFKDVGAARDLFFGIIDSFSHGSRLASKGLLCELLEMLISENFPELLSYTYNTTYNIAEQIKEYIDSGQGLQSGLDSFEKYFSYSKFHLERSFKKKFGTSIIAYRNEKRLEKSLELLKSKNTTNIAEELGFGSVYSFSRAFKNKYGVSPTKYIK